MPNHIAPRLLLIQALCLAVGIALPTVDGQAPGATHGLDIDDKGYGKVTDQRLYQLIRQPGTIQDRLFEIEFLDPGVEAFAFTFG
jgi:hypothetical protein